MLKQVLHIINPLSDNVGEDLEYKKYLKQLILMQSLCFIFLNILYIKGVGIMFTGIYENLGFTLEFSIFKIIISLVIFALILYQVKFIKNHFILLVWNIIFVYQFSSELIYFMHTNNASFVQIISVSLVLLMLITVSYFKGVLRVNNVMESSNLFEILAYVMFAPFLFLYFRYIDLSNLINRNVYETRAIFREISVPITGYLMAPLARVLLPSLIVQNFKKEKVMKVILFSLMIIYLYLCGALKSVYIGLFAAIFFYFGTFKQKTYYLLKIFSFVFLVILILFFFTENYKLIDLPIRRVFFVPPHLNNIYNNYFSDNFTYLSHSPFGLGLVEPTIKGNLPHYIGEFIIGKKGLSANIGVYTEGWLSLGLIGTVLFSLVISFVFFCLQVVRIKPEYFGIVFVYIYYLNTALLSTLLLTHALAFFILFSYLFLGDNKRSVDDELEKEINAIW